MFSRKSDIYKSIESKIILDIHQAGVYNLKINVKLRFLLIFFIIFSVLSPWYYRDIVYGNVYLFMVCDNNYFPIDCINFYKLKKECSLTQDICNKSYKDMNGGAMMLVASFICLIFQIISIFNLKAYIEGKKNCKNAYFCMISSLIYSIAFTLWNCLSDFRPSVDSPNYGLTAAFTVIFFQVFLLIHFLKFRNYVVEYYLADPSMSGESISRSISMQKD